MKSWFKELFIPSGEKTTVVAYNSWVVRWTKVRSVSYNSGDSFSFRETPEAEIFPSEIDANRFADQLREAFKLLRQTGDATRVKVESNQSTLAMLKS